MGRLYYRGEQPSQRPCILLIASPAEGQISGDKTSKQRVLRGHAECSGIFKPKDARLEVAIYQLRDLIKRHAREAATNKTTQHFVKQIREQTQAIEPGSRNMESGVLDGEAYSIGMASPRRLSEVQERIRTLFSGHRSRSGKLTIDSPEIQGC